MTTQELFLYNDALTTSLFLDRLMPVYFADLNAEKLSAAPFFAPHTKATGLPKDTMQPVCIVVTLPKSPKEINTVIHTIPTNSILVCTGRNNKSLWGKSSMFSPRRLFDQQIATIFQEPIGKFAPGHKILQPLRFLPVSRFWSPYTLHVYKKVTNRATFTPYRSRTRLVSRLSRVIERGVYKFNNHPINDAYSKIIASLKLLPFAGNILYNRQFKQHKKLVSSDQRISIAIVTGQLAVGGVERVLLNILKDLPKDKYKATIYTTTWNAHEWDDEFKKYSDNIIHVPEILGHRWPQAYVKKYLSNSLVNLNPSLIFITNSSDGYAALPSVTQHIRPKVIDLLHTYGTPTEKGAFLRISQPYNRLIDRRVAISNFLREYLVKHYPVSPQKIRTIYNGIPRTSRRINALRREGSGYLGTTQQETAISFLGRLQSDKSPDRIIEVGYMLRDTLRKKRAFLAIVGEGNMEQELKDRAKELGIYNKEVRFFPFTTSPQAVAAASRYTIITSNLEGLPMSVLESMQVGTPVIASAVGGVPEIIDNHSGFLVPIDQSLSEKEILDRFAKSLAKALDIPEDQYVAMQQSAKKKIKSTFTHMTDEYKALFEEVLSPSVED